MRTVITGASGFIGSRLLKSARLAFGDDVVAFTSRSGSYPEIVYKKDSNFGLTAVELETIEKTEVLIHAGAFTPKSSQEADDIDGCNGNITFTARLLALPWHKLRKIIFLSTLDVYAEIPGAISEKTAVMPASLYGMSKFYCERIVEIYVRRRSLTSQILRIGHVYGPGEEQYAKVIPKSIQSILTGAHLELWGCGAEQRSFIYIDDVVRAILAAAESTISPGVINVVSGNSISIRELLDKLIAIGGRPVRIIQREREFKGRDFVFDNRLLKQYLLSEETDFTIGLQSEFAHIQKLAGKLDGVHNEPNL